MSISVLSAVLVALVVVACGSSSSEEVTQPPRMTPEPPGMMPEPPGMMPEPPGMMPEPPEPDVIEFNVLRVRESAGGSVQVTREGTGIRITATPDEDYFFEQWRCVDNSSCPITENDSPSLTFTSAELLAEIYPTFNTTATISLSVAEGGSATADCELECGDLPGWNTRISATPDDGYRFVRWDCIGLATCMEFNNRFDTEVELMVSDDVTLVPVYEQMARIQLTVQSSPNGSVMLDTECGDDCEFGIGWVAVLRAVPDEGYAFNGWRCVGNGDCPDEITDNQGLELRFAPTENITIAADFTEAPPFYVASSDIFIPGSVPASVAEAVVCDDGGCVHIIGGDTVGLTAIGADRDASYEWSVIGDAPHLDIPIPTAPHINLRVAEDVRGVVVSELEVVAKSLGTGIERRATITVVAIPPALAIRLGPSDGCSGSVIERAGENYVLTAAHCLHAHGRELRLYANSAIIRYGAPNKIQTVTGEVIGVDEVSDIAVLSIPDLRFPWVPATGRTLIALGDQLRGVSRPSAADLSSTPGNNRTLVTAGQVSRVRDTCSSYSLELRGDLEIEGFSGCDDVTEVEISPNLASFGSSGGPLLNSEGDLIGVINGGVASSSGVRSIGTVFGFSNLLDDILDGGKRCIEREYNDNVVTTVGARRCEFER